MKTVKFLSLLLLITLFTGVFGCQKESEPEKSDESIETEIETSDPTTESTAESSEESLEEPEETEESEEKQTQRFEFEINDKNRRGVKSVEVGLTADSEYGFSAHEDHWSDKVPGIVGVSVRYFLLPVDDPETDLSLPENITFTFNYEEDELMGVPEENLIVLYCEDDTFDCSVVEGSEIDIENNKVTADFKGIFGICMLADAYQWYLSQGIDASEYAYELPDEILNMSDWEKEFDTGSILDLVDHDYIDKSEAVFHVSTPEQLASVVYYVNTQVVDIPGWNSGNFAYAEIYLESDIDLTGYDWMPLGWTSEKGYDSLNFTGIIDGQGHTIKGLKINGRRNCGFVGYSTSVDMKDITFTDADITGNWCVGICAGQIIGGGKWENVHASGNLNVKGTANEGGLTGWITDLRFENCSAEYTINGGDEVLHYLSYIEKRTEEIGITETFNITLSDDYTVTRDEHSDFRSLTWHVELDGQTILGRDAEDSTILPASGYMLRRDNSGTYTIYLEAHIDDIYIRVSNIIEFTI